MVGTLFLGTSAGMPYIYTEDGNINFRYKNSSGDYAYSSIRGINEALDKIHIVERTENYSFVPGNGSDVILNSIHVEAGVWLFIGQVTIPVNANSGAMRFAVTQGKTMQSSNVYSEIPFKSGAFAGCNMTWSCYFSQPTTLYLVCNQNSGIDTDKCRYYLQAIRLK